jgi:hypothetical protein
MARRKATQTEDEVDETTKPIERDYDASGNMIVKLSERATATIRELDGHESIIADAYASASMSGLVILKLYALISIQTLTIDGAKVILPPAMKNLIECYNRAKKLSSRELTVLMETYTVEFMGAPLDEAELKN